MVFLFQLQSETPSNPTKSKKKEDDGMELINLSSDEEPRSENPSRVNAAGSYFHLDYFLLVSFLRNQPSPR